MSKPNDPEDILGQVLARLLKIDIIERVDVEKEGRDYVIYAYFNVNKMFIRHMISIEMLETAIDLPGYVEYTVKRYIELELDTLKQKEDRKNFFS